MLLQTAFRDIGAGLWPLAMVSLAIVLGGPALAQGDKPVAVVNNDTITEREFFNRLQRVKGADFLVPTSPPSMRTESAGYIVLNSIINERLILQLAAKDNLTPTDAEIHSDLDPLLTQDNIKKAISDHIVTEDEIKYDVTVQKARFNLATTRQTVTPAEVEDFYNKHINNYKSPEKWGLSAIRTSKIDTAAKIITELQTGKSFEETARNYSEDERTRTSGGKIGVFDATDKALPEEIRKGVSALKLGEYTQPIGVQFDPGNGSAKVLTYWIVKLTVKQPAVTHEFAEVKKQVERLAVLEKVGGMETGDKKIADFRKTADIKVSLPGYDELTNANRSK